MKRELRTAEEKIRAIASDAHGAVTRSELLEAGVFIRVSPFGDWVASTPPASKEARMNNLRNYT
jgi:hypothetical protein